MHGYHHMAMMPLRVAPNEDRPSRDAPADGACDAALTTYASFRDAREARDLNRNCVGCMCTGTGAHGHGVLGTIYAPQSGA